MGNLRVAILSIAALSIVLLAVGYFASTDVVGAITGDAVTSFDLVVAVVLLLALDRVLMPMLRREARP